MALSVVVRVSRDFSLSYIGKIAPVYLRQDQLFGKIPYTRGLFARSLVNPFDDSDKNAKDLINLQRQIC